MTVKTKAPAKKTAAAKVPAKATRKPPTGARRGKK